MRRLFTFAATLLVLSLFALTVTAQDADGMPHAFKEMYSIVTVAE